MALQADVDAGGLEVTKTVSVRPTARVAIVTIERPEARNAVDLATARALYDAFKRFDADASADVAVLTGAGGASAPGPTSRRSPPARPGRIEGTGDFGPMGPTRLQARKARHRGDRGAGGGGRNGACALVRPAHRRRSAVFGVFNRRFGVPLIDLGTIRLPRIVGHGRAMDLILTGRPVAGGRGAPHRPGERGDGGRRGARARRGAGPDALGLPAEAMRNDRLSAIEQWELGEGAWRNEVARGSATIASGEAREGPAQFAQGAGRGGRFAGEG